MSLPVWMAATSGARADAGAVNQFLVTHASSFIYQGTSVVSQTTAGTGGVGTDNQYVAQSFVMPTGQTSISYVGLSLTVVGSPTVPLVVQLQSDSGGLPSGTVLASTAVPAAYVTGGWCDIPLPVSVTAGATYHLVLPPAGDASDYYQWGLSNQTSGEQTGTNANPPMWTAVAAGLLYQVYAEIELPPVLAFLYDDNGARWVSLTYTGGQLVGIAEFTEGQTATSGLYSSRTVSYTSAGVLSGVT